MDAAKWRTLVDKVGVVLACIINAEEIVKELEEKGQQFTLRSLADCELIDICNDVPESELAKAALGILKARFRNYTCEQYVAHANDAKRGRPFSDYLIRRVRATATSFEHWMLYWLVCFSTGIPEEAFTFDRIREIKPSPENWLDVLSLKLGSQMREGVVREIINHPDVDFDTLREALYLLVFDDPADRMLAEKIFACMQSRYSSFEDWYSLVEDFSMGDFWDRRFLIEAAKSCNGDPERWKEVLAWLENKTSPEVLAEIRKDAEADTAYYTIDVWIDLAQWADRWGYDALMTLVCDRVGRRELNLQECKRIFTETPSGTPLHKLIQERVTTYERN